MSTDNREVIFKLTVQQQDAAKQVEQLATGTERVSKAAQSAEEQFRRMGRSAQGVNAGGGVSGMPAGGGAPAGRGLAAAAGAAGAVFSLGAANYAAGVAANRFNAVTDMRSWADRQPYPTSWDQRAGHLAAAEAESVPVLGRLVQALRHVNEAALESIKYLGQVRAAYLERNLGAASSLRQADIGLAVNLSGTGRSVAGAEAAQFSARQVAGGLAPGQPYRPLDMLQGVGDLAAAQLRLRSEQDSLTKLESKVNLPGLQGAAFRSRDDFNAASDRYRDAFGRYSRRSGVMNLGEDTALARATADVRAKAVIDLQRQQDVQKGINVLEAQHNRLLEAKSSLAQAQLRLDETRLNAARGLAVAVGGAQPGMAEAALMAIRLGKQIGFNNLDPDLQGLVRGFGGGELIDRSNAKRAQGLPVFGELGQEIGIETDVGRITGRAGGTFEQALAQSRAQYQDATVDFTKQFASDIGQYFAEFRNAVRREVQTALGLKNVEAIEAQIAGR